MILFMQNIWQRPVLQPMDVAQLSLAIEDFLRPFTVEAEVAGESAKELDDLRDVVVVFAVFGTGLRVEEVVAGDEFEDLGKL